MKCSLCKGTNWSVDPDSSLKLVACPICITIPFDKGFLSFYSEENPYILDSDEAMEWQVGRSVRNTEMYNNEWT